MIGSTSSNLVVCMRLQSPSKISCIWLFASRARDARLTTSLTATAETAAAFAPRRIDA